MIIYDKSLFQPKHNVIKCCFNNNLDKDNIHDLLEKERNHKQGYIRW